MDKMIFVIVLQLLLFGCYLVVLAIEQYWLCFGFRYQRVQSVSASVLSACQVYGHYRVVQVWVQQRVRRYWKRMQR